MIIERSSLQLSLLMEALKPNSSVLGWADISNNNNNPGESDNNSIQIEGEDDDENSGENDESKKGPGRRALLVNNMLYPSIFIVFFL